MFTSTYFATRKSIPNLEVEVTPHPVSTIDGEVQGLYSRHGVVRVAEPVGLDNQKEGGISGLLLLSMANEVTLWLRCPKSQLVLSSERQEDAVPIHVPETWCRE